MLYDDLVDDLIGRLGNAPIGNLTYVIYRLILARWQSNPSYTVGVEIVGCLNTVNHELIRQYLDPYEDAKIVENGNIT